MKKIIVPIIVIGLLSGTSLLCMGNAQGVIEKQLMISNNPVDYWGILISNTYSWDSNFALAFRDILCENGWQQNHIKYFDYYNATYDNVVNALLWLASNSDSNDKVLFYDLSHGTDEFFCLDNSAIMYYSKLDQFFDNVTYGGLTVILNGCESGGAIPYLEKEKRVILTASDANHSASSDFSWFCLNALQGFADFEGDNNKLVSAEEIYNFVKNDTADYHGGRPPLISDNYDGELYNTHFNYLNWPGLLDQYAIHRGNSNARINNNSWCAQSFVPTYPILTAVMLDLSVHGNPGSLIISIKEDLYGNDTCSVTVDQNSFYPGVQRFWIINLPNITVTPGQKYWIVIKSYTSEGEYYIVNGFDSYPEGEKACSQNHGVTWDIYYASSSDYYFVTLGRPVDSPPTVPIATGPSLGSLDDSYTYTATASDADGDPVYYKWDWGDGSFSDWLGPYASGQPIQITHSWSEKGTYTIRVMAKDAFCAWSTWSEPLTMTITNEPPAVPTISGPHLIKLGVNYTYTFVTTDPDNDVITYIIRWGDVNGNETFGPYASGVEESATHRWMEDADAYCIRIKARDAHGEESDWKTIIVIMDLDQSSSQPGSQSQPQVNPSSQSQQSSQPSSQPSTNQQSITSTTTTTSKPATTATTTTSTTPTSKSTSLPTSK